MVRIEEAREGMFRRAAFGLEDEIVPLVRGREYGGRADGGCWILREE
jgi:hypothetical protein